METRKLKLLAILAALFLIVGYFGSIACYAQNNHACCSADQKTTCEMEKGNFSDAAPRIQLDGPVYHAVSAPAPVKVKAAAPELVKKQNISVQAPRDNPRLKTHHLTNAPPLA